MTTGSFVVNGREYQLPNRPVAVICLDGSADEYLDAALVRGRMPRLAEMTMRGYRGLARGALPSFTNTNNVSIVTGVSPAVHGICGNFFLNPETGQEVMMNSPEYLRTGTILAGAARAGRKVAMVTAKEKLRTLLGHELEGIAFSSEKAREAVELTHGIKEVERRVGEPTPPIYSGEASLYVLKAGVALVAQGLADFLYLSLTDFIQHKFEPEAAEAVSFYAGIDREVGRLLDLGVRLGATADHGMNAKQTVEGHPNVIYLETVLLEELGVKARVLLPITDPYVVHHGALGSFAVVHLADSTEAVRVRDWLLERPELTEVYDRKQAARRLELPVDRLGDLVVLSRRDVAIGRTPAYHDLSLLQDRLRSHGGRYEEMVPFMVSEKLKPAYAFRAVGDVRNFDIFDFTLNGVK